MRILTAVQALFALAWIGLGLVLLFGIGITGLLLLVPGALLAATAGLVQGGSRAGVATALLADAVVASFAWARLATLLRPDAAARPLGQAAGGLKQMVDYGVPGLALALVAIGVIGLLCDWRALRAAPWW